MKLLKIGIAGVRGVVGESFTPELIVGFAQAFGTYMDGSRILVCRDTRPSGPMVQAAVSAGLLGAGCEVIDLGVSATPTLQLAVEQLGASGGIAITAGHNPEQWNALKFVRKDGLYLNATQGEELLDIYHQGEFAKTSWDQIKTSVQTFDATNHHIDKLTSAFDVEAIRQRRLTVAVDYCNGACVLLISSWLKELGCEVLAINDDSSAPFPHSPEPKRANMLWGIAALTLFGTGALTNGIPAPVVNGHTLSPIDAMPAMLANILGPGVRGIVVAGMLAATMSVNSSYLLGWSAVISQDVILPIRRALGKGALSSRSQIFVNRLANLFVSLFLMFWGLYYTPPGAVYLYLNITGTIFLAGAFVCVVGGLYWRRANTLGGYLAMILGAAGAIIPYFFLHWSENVTGFAAFGLAACGLVIGSMIGPAAVARTQEAAAAD